MTNETKQQIKENETTVNRWKEERLSRILDQSVRLPESAAKAFYKITDEFTSPFSGGDLREKIDAKMPSLWELMPPPMNETEWTDYFNDLLADCAATQCVTVREVWQIIGYDAAEFEKKRTRGFTFTQAFEQFYMDETPEQMDERTKDLTLEQCRERIEHGVNQWREGLTEVARLRNDVFKKFGENIPLENGF
jgi:hypothetical protein